MQSLCQGRVLIHFDGWSINHDYWARPDGPNLHPVGWASSTKRKLIPPQDSQVCQVKILNWWKWKPRTLHPRSPGRLTWPAKGRDLFQLGLSIQPPTSKFTKCHQGVVFKLIDFFKIFGLWISSSHAINGVTTQGANRIPSRSTAWGGGLPQPLPCQVS